MYMFKYILKRIGLMIVTFCVIFTICFILIKMLPVNMHVGIGEDPMKVQQLFEDREYNKPVL